MTFDFDPDSFPQVDPTAVARYARSFVHKDWEDGVSTIQAGSNGAEEGFNVRFHRIETDLDALGGDSQAAITAVAKVRSQLFDLLHDIGDELNKLDNPSGEAWKTVPPAVGWSLGLPGDQGNPLSYFVDRSGMVHVRGALSSSGAPSSDPGLTICKLPVVPENRCVFVVASGADTSRVDVAKDGTVAVRGNYQGWVSLDGLQFRQKS